MARKYIVFTSAKLPLLSLSAITPLHPFITCCASVYDVPLRSILDHVKTCGNGVEVSIEGIRYAKRNKIAKLIGREHTTHARFWLNWSEVHTAKMYIYDTYALVQVSESSPHGITGVIW